MDVTRASVAGANDYFVKPLDLDGFIREIEMRIQPWIEAAAKVGYAKVADGLGQT